MKFSTHRQLRKIGVAFMSSVLAEPAHGLLHKAPPTPERRREKLGPQIRVASLTAEAIFQIEWDAVKAPQNTQMPFLVAHWSFFTVDLTDNDAMIALKGPYLSIILTNSQSKAKYLW